MQQENQETQENIVLRIIDRINERWGKLVSYVILAMMSVTVFEVVARYAFNRPTTWAHETTEMMLGVYIILGAGFTLVRNVPSKHIRMDVFYTRFSPRGKAIIDLVTSIAFFLFVGMVLWQGWEMAVRSVKLWEHSMSVWSPPVWPVKICLPIGAFLLLVMGVVRFVRNIITVRTGGREVNSG